MKDREPARNPYCPTCGGLQGHWAHRRSDCLYELRARMGYLASQLDLGTAAEPADARRALDRLQERIDDLLAPRIAYAPDYPLPRAA
jgi:hypothetical protein